MPLNKNLDSGLSSCLAGTTKRDSSRVCLVVRDPKDQRELIEESSGADITPKVKSLANMELRRICAFGAGASGGHLAAIGTSGIALREDAHAHARTIAGRACVCGRPAGGAQGAIFALLK
jgi:hypothetical protein